MALCLTAGCSQPPPLHPLVVTEVQGKENELNIWNLYPNQALIDVVTPTGVGAAIIRVVEGAAYPQHLHLRLHLNHLEAFQLQYGRTIIQLSVVPHSADALSVGAAGNQAAQADIRQEVAVDNTQERFIPITPADSHWLTVQIVPPAQQITPGGSPGANGIGTIDLQLPPDFFARQPTHFSISWIDFYR